MPVYLAFVWPVAAKTQQIDYVQLSVATKQSLSNGQYARAIDLLEVQIAHCQRGKQRIERCLLPRMSILRAAYRAGQPLYMWKHGRGILAQLEQLAPQQREGLAEFALYSGIGSLHGKRLDEAENFLRYSLEQTGSADNDFFNSIEAAAWRALGEVSLERKDSVQAEQYLLNAIVVAETKLPQNVSERVNSYILYAENMRSPLALDYALRAVDVLANGGHASSGAMVRALSIAADRADQSGDIELRISLRRRSYELVRDLSGFDDFFYPPRTLPAHATVIGRATLCRGFRCA